MLKKFIDHSIRYNSLILLVVIFIVASHGAAAAAEYSNQVNGGISSAIVKVYTVISSPDYYRPWQQEVHRGVGSGFIIDGNRILTNAHVVANLTFVEVRKNGDPKRYQARVLSVSHEADLALLTVDDPVFFQQVEVIQFDDLPRTQQEILVYGFPTGGDTLSITKGIVSRIEHIRYSHSSLSFLAGQIDAAINVGNSGGPAISNGYLVGVAMQGRTDADNIGYLIPIPVIKHFLKDIEDGSYDGFPELGIITQNMENPALKQKYGMAKEQSGVMIRHLLPGSTAEEVLRKEDVLLAIDSHPIADDGTVEFRPRERTFWGHFVDAHQIGDEVRFSILRDGSIQEVSIIADKRADQVFSGLIEQYDKLPRYFIFGGIVFCPLSKNLLLEWGVDWQTRAPNELIVELNKLPNNTEKECVIALHVLAADVNKGYHNVSRDIIRKIDGETYRDFDDFYQKVTTGSDPYIVFEDWRKNQIVIDRQEALSSHQRILNTYSINQDRSLGIRVND